jgi:hypothetical protein
MTLLSTVVLALALAVSAYAQADPGDPPRIPYQFRADAAGTKPPHPGYCLDLKDGVRANGTPVQLYVLSSSLD